MKTKSGITIPAVLSTKIGHSKALTEAWNKLRPSCQENYAERVENAATPAAKEQKANKAAELTRQYAERHKHKYKTQP